LLQKVSGQRDIVVGSPVAGRDHADLENQIGFYANTLALLNTIEPERSFEEQLTHIRTSTLLAYEHQVYPFDRLVDELDGARDNSRSPLFDVLVVLQNAQTGGESVGMKGLAVSPFPIASQTSKFDLTFNFSQANDVIHCELEYNIDLFDKASVQLLKEQFIAIVQAVVAHPQAPIHTIALLGERKKNKKSLTFNFE
jgi:non-ribosomal peptide synthetase component F